MPLIADHKVWPNITIKKPPPPDSKDWEAGSRQIQAILLTKSRAPVKINAAPTEEWPI